MLQFLISNSYNSNKLSLLIVEVQQQSDAQSSGIKVRKRRFMMNEQVSDNTGTNLLRQSQYFKGRIKFSAINGPSVAQSHELSNREYSSSLPKTYMNSQEQMSNSVQDIFNTSIDSADLQRLSKKQIVQGRILKQSKTPTSLVYKRRFKNGAGIQILSNSEQMEIQEQFMDYLLNINSNLFCEQSAGKSNKTFIKQKEDINFEKSLKSHEDLHRFETFKRIVDQTPVSDANEMPIIVYPSQNFDQETFQFQNQLHSNLSRASNEIREVNESGMAGGTDDFEFYRTDTEQ